MSTQASILTAFSQDSVVLNCSFNIFIQISNLKARNPPTAVSKRGLIIPLCSHISDSTKPTPCSALFCSGGATCTWHSRDLLNEVCLIQPVLQHAPLLWHTPLLFIILHSLCSRLGPVFFHSSPGHHKRLVYWLLYRKHRMLLESWMTDTYRSEYNVLVCCITECGMIHYLYYPLGKLHEEVDI